MEDPVHGQTGAAAVRATVEVTVRRIPAVAVTRSGSLRVRGRPEELVARDPETGKSKADRFAGLMKKYLNASVVDVFTIMVRTRENNVTSLRPTST